MSSTIRDWRPELCRTLEARPWAAVLVDYFGTLVTRTVPPWYVKLLAARRLVEQLGLRLDPQELYRARVDVERELSAERVQRGDDPDCRLDEVGERLSRALGSQIHGAMTTDDFISLLLDAEVAMEVETERLDKELVSHLETQAATSGLAIVSDFYLPRPSFEELLEHHHVGAIFPDIFVSCDHGRTKRTGRLFELVVERLDVDPADVLVIGDDPTSDGHRPGALGMTTFVRPRGRWEERKRAGAAEVERDVDRGIADLLRPVDSSDLFTELALTLYVFVRRLHNRLRADGVTDAFFLAREGLFLARLLGAYQDESSLPGAMRVTVHDLMVSRRATSASSGALDQYLRQELDVPRRKVVHIVDVGWKGTTQDQLADRLPEGIALVGWYLGLLSPSGDASAKSGVLFHNWPRRSDHLEVFQHFKSIFEVLLGGAEGSVRTYELREDRAVPVLEDNVAERNAYSEYIATVQRHVDRRFRLLCQEFQRSMRNDDELLDVAARYHARMVFRPSLEELRFFEDIPFFDAGRKRLGPLGIPETGSTTENGRRVASLLDPRRLVRGGGWPPLRMRAAGLGWLRFPYAWYKLVSQRHRGRRLRRARQRVSGSTS